MQSLFDLIDRIISMFFTFLGIYILLVIVGVTVAESWETITALWQWIVAHRWHIIAVIVSTASFIWIAVFAHERGIFPKAFKILQSAVICAWHRIKHISKKIIDPIIAWNERHKPKDARSMRRYGFLVFLIGVVGFLIFIADGHWIISIWYFLFIVAGIYEMLLPEHALYYMHKDKED